MIKAVIVRPTASIAGRRAIQSRGGDQSRIVPTRFYDVCVMIAAWEPVAFAQAIRRAFTMYVFNSPLANRRLYSMRAVATIVLARWFRRGMRQVLKHPIWAIGVVVGLVVLPILISESVKPIVTIEPIAVTKELEEAGYTSVALTDAVRTEAMRIDAVIPEGQGGPRGTTFRRSDQRELIDFEIPGTKIAYQQVMQAIRRIFARPPTSVWIQVVNVDDVTTIFVRVIEPSFSPVESKRELKDNAKPIHVAVAEEVLSLLEPARLASYFCCKMRRADEAKWVLERCVTQMDPRRKAQCLIVKGDIEENDDHYDEAATYYKEALDWNPESGEAHSAMAWLAYLQGNTVSALEQLDQALKVEPDRAVSTPLRQP